MKSTAATRIDMYGLYFFFSFSKVCVCVCAIHLFWATVKPACIKCMVYIYQMLSVLMFYRQMMKKIFLFCVQFTTLFSHSGKNLINRCCDGFFFFFFFFILYKMNMICLPARYFFLQQVHNKKFNTVTLKCINVKTYNSIQLLILRF